MDTELEYQPLWIYSKIEHGSMSQDKFKKTEAQRLATKVLTGPAKHVCLSGGSRSGKSFLLMYAMVVRACKVKSRHCIFRLNFNHVKRSIVLETFPKVMSLCFPNLKYELNKTDYIATFPNGSQIFFAGLDTGERVEKVLGQEFSGIWYNEISQIPYSSVQMALTRLAEKNDLKKKVYYDMNPGLKSSWSYALFINKLDPIENTPLINPENYEYFKMNPEGNLENIDQDYLKILESMPEKEKLRFLQGEFGDESDGAAYYEFRREKHIADVKQTNGTTWCASDWNVSPFCSVIYQIVNNEFHIIDEIWMETGDTYKLCSELKSRGLAGIKIVPDATGKARRTSGKSDFDIMKENGFQVMSTYNPYQTDRVLNVNRLLASNRIKINPKCRKLIGDFEKVVWKNNKLDQTGNNKMQTHLTDCVGYACWYHDPIVSTPLTKFSTIER
jgi:phage terminase large subunit